MTTAQQVTEDRVTETTRRRTRGPTPSFLLHLGQLVVVMVVGMGVLDPVIRRVLSLAGLSVPLATPEGVSVGMAISMAVPLAVLMLNRGHSRSAIAHMSVAMFVPFLVALVPYWAGVVSGGAAVMAGHVLILPAAVIAMLIRRHEYTHARPYDAPGAGHPAADGWARRLAGRWPSMVGLVFAGFVILDVTRGIDLAPIVAASAAVYIIAAAVGKPSAAWPVFLATGIAVTWGEVLGQRTEVVLVLLGVGVALAGVGVLRGAARPAHGLPLQSVALLVFGAAAVLAVVVSPDFGGYLVAAGLFGHAIWDVYHHRTHRVVARSFAEFCAVLDTVLAVAIVLVTALH